MMTEAICRQYALRGHHTAEYSYPHLHHAAQRLPNSRRQADCLLWLAAEGYVFDNGDNQPARQQHGIASGHGAGMKPQSYLPMVCFTLARSPGMSRCCGHLAMHTPQPVHEEAGSPRCTGDIDTVWSAMARSMLPCNR